MVAMKVDQEGQSSPSTGGSTVVKVASLAPKGPLSSEVTGDLSPGLREPGGEFGAVFTHLGESPISSRASIEKSELERATLISIVNNLEQKRPSAAFSYSRGI